MDVGTYLILVGTLPTTSLQVQRTFSVTFHDTKYILYIYQLRKRAAGSSIQLVGAGWTGGRLAGSSGSRGWLEKATFNLYREAAAATDDVAKGACYCLRWPRYPAQQKKSQGALLLYILTTYIHILSFRNTMLLRKQERKEGNERALSRYVPVLYVDLKSEKGTNVFFFQVE